MKFKFKFKIPWYRVFHQVIKLYRSCMAKFQENRPAIILTLLFCKNIFLNNLLVIAAIVEILIWVIDNKSKK